MPIEADSAEEAIARDGNGGGNWTAAYVDEGEQGLPIEHLTIGGLTVHCYQHTGPDGAIAVVEVDHADTYPARVYVEDALATDNTL